MSLSSSLILCTARFLLFLQQHWTVQSIRVDHCLLVSHCVSTPYLCPVIKLQVLYFTPAFRAAILQHKPEPSLEFCLTCELLFLFKMLLSAAGGLPCQALNLLRALRQNREAAALGLLEGTVAANGASQGLGLGSSSGQGLGYNPNPNANLGGLGFSAVSPGLNPNANPNTPEGWASVTKPLSVSVMAKPYDGLGVSPTGEGLGVGGFKAQDWGSSAARLAAKSGLPKRVVTLCRFLLDHLYK